MTTSPSPSQAAPLPQTPYSRFWGEGTRSLPQALILPPGRKWMAGVVAPAWIATGPAELPFDFCGHVRRLAADVVSRCQIFHPIDMSRVLITAIQARSSRPHGLQARVTPLRFAGGELVHVRRGRPYQVQRYFVDGREMLYVLTFCLPRFLDQAFEDKLVTLFHELYHISPQFNGDLRRLGGRYSVHSCSKREYDESIARIVRTYLNDGPDPALHGFLRLSFAQLRARHGGVAAVIVPRPKLVPVRPSTRLGASATAARARQAQVLDQPS
jgi:hypothetical protein